MAQTQMVQVQLDGTFGPITDPSEASEVATLLTGFHGEMQDEGDGVWLVEMPQALVDRLIAFGELELADEHEEMRLYAEWPL